MLEDAEGSAEVLPAPPPPPLVLCEALAVVVVVVLVVVLVLAVAAACPGRLLLVLLPESWPLRSIGLPSPSLHGHRAGTG